MKKELCMPLESTDHKQRLSELSRGLRDLHRALVKAAQTEYEIQWGPVNDPGHLLQLLTKHPEFDWLHQLSEFMVGVDELLDAELVSESDQVRPEIRIDGCHVTDYAFVSGHLGIFEAISRGAAQRSLNSDSACPCAKSSHLSHEGLQRKARRSVAARRH
jgi:hypothetical protein